MLGTVERTIDEHTFLKGLICALVMAGIEAIRPAEPATVKGFEAVVSSLDRAVESVDDSVDFERADELVTLRNSLEPSVIGAFDDLELVLRDLQTSATSLPNPHYEEMRFGISTPFAESFLARLEKKNRDLIENTAKSFLEALG